MPISLYLLALFLNSTHICILPFRTNSYLNTLFLCFKPLQFRGLYVLCKWTSPVILAFAYYRGYFSYEGIESISFLAYVFGVVLITTYVARGFGRCSNLDYKNFMDKFSQLNKNDANVAERKVFCFNVHYLQLSHTFLTGKFDDNP